MTRIQIRNSVISDASKLASTYRNAYRETRELGFPMQGESVTEDQVSEWIQNHRVYVATADDDIIGGVRLEETDPNRVKLSRLGVHDEWKNHGIGSQLLEYAESKERERGYNVIWLTTPEEHPYLPEFYRGHGYGKKAPYPVEFREYDEVIMEKPL